MPNYATIFALKEATDIVTSEFAKEVNLANLNSVVGKLDIDKLKIVPVDLSKSSDVIKNNVFKDCI